MFLEKAVVSHHEKMNPMHYRITLTCDASFQDATPGQFVMLHLPDGDSPFLPRPFSIHRITRVRDGRTGVQVLYRVVGAMTRKMSRVRVGDIIQIVGPLGRGFTLPGEVSRPVIVAGGIGVAPLIFLAETLLEKGKDPGRCVFFLGARDKNTLLCREELVRMGMNVHITTDDGSAGECCLVTHPVQVLAGTDPPDILYACGPVEMLRCVAQMARVMKIPCQVSIETLMACGIGACLGCAVEGKSKDRYLHACMDGPVFDAETLLWG